MIRVSVFGWRVQVVRARAGLPDVAARTSLVHVARLTLRSRRFHHRVGILAFIPGLATGHRQSQCRQYNKCFFHNPLSLKFHWTNIRREFAPLNWLHLWKTNRGKSLPASADCRCDIIRCPVLRFVFPSRRGRLEWRRVRGSSQQRRAVCLEFCRKIFRAGRLCAS